MTACVLAGVLTGVAVWLWHAAPVPLPRRSGAGGAAGSLAPGLTVTAGRVADLAEQLAAGLDAGLGLPVAWSHVVGDGGADAVLVASDGPARVALLAMRAALRLSDGHGVPAAAVLRAAAVSVRDGLDAEAARRAATSGPVAAAWIVAGLPVIGPLLAAALGIDPVAILTQTVWGRLCGAAGVTFLVLGALWSRHLVVRARAGAGR